MMSEKNIVMSSYAIAATVALCATLISGCDQPATPAPAELEEVYPAEGNAYMHDPAFRAKLDVQAQVKNDLRKSRLAINRELDELLKAHGGDYAAVTNTARGAELAAAVLRNERLFASNRMEVARLTRERIKRANEDSLRIQRGEAKAIEISKKKEAK